MSTYKIEVWNKSGICLGDIRHLAHDLKWSEQRNAPEGMSFTMDVIEYEQYLDSINMTPYDFMDAGTTDIRLVRDGVERIGVHLIDFDNDTDDPSVKVIVSLDGYLNYFKDAYVDASYDNIDQGDILWGVINQQQSKPYGNFGITKGSNVSRGQKRDRHQTRAQVKDFIVRMTNVINGPDIQFTPNKEFHSYDAIGSYRPDIRLIYPDNVQSFKVKRSVSPVANFIYALGSGNGDDAIAATSQDTASMANRYRREKVVTFNSVEDSTTLQQNADGVKEATKEIYEIPVFTLRDGILNVNDVRAGDTVYGQITGRKMYEHIFGSYRIERLEVDVDDNDSETVRVFFDDINIDSIIEQQEAGDA